MKELAATKEKVRYSELEMVSSKLSLSDDSLSAREGEGQSGQQGGRRMQVRQRDYFCHKTYGCFSKI